MRQAFSELGHDVWSCDILPSVDGSNRHIVGDIRDLLNDGWDLLAVMHPPCTRLCNSGVRWLSEPPTKLNETYSSAERQAYLAMDREDRLRFMWTELDKGAALFSDCWNAPIERIAIENPVMHRHAKERIRGYQAPAQTVQPWWFGDPALKATSFYLKGLPKLVATDRLTPPAAGTIERNEWSKVHRAPPSPDRWKLRSETYPGIAKAAAAQWGGYALEVAA
jgi:hypothetical protein